MIKNELDRSSIRTIKNYVSWYRHLPYCVYSNVSNTFWGAGSWSYTKQWFDFHNTTMYLQFVKQVFYRWLEGISCESCLKIDEYSFTLCNLYSCWLAFSLTKSTVSWFLLHIVTLLNINYHHNFIHAVNDKQSWGLTHASAIKIRSRVSRLPHYFIFTRKENGIPIRFYYSITYYLTT